MKAFMTRLTFPLLPAGGIDLTHTHQLLDHLPRSVKGVGEELARGDSSLESFDGFIVAKIKPSNLLGFVVVVRHLASWRPLL